MYKLLPFLSTSSRRALAIFLLITTILLTACSDKTNKRIQGAVGLNIASPDEFTVISYPPLTVPPFLHKCGVKEDKASDSSK